MSDGESGDSAPTRGDPRRTAAVTVLVPRVHIHADRAEDLAARFSDFAEACHRFSREIVERSGVTAKATASDHIRLNMQIARTIFGKWSIEILAFLYTGRAAGFQEIKKGLGPISSRVLSVKLARLERLGLVRREVLGMRPPRVRYSLTRKGLQVARLGEPVFLYLRLTEGLLIPTGDAGIGP